MHTRSLITRSAIVLETVILPFRRARRVAVLHHHGHELVVGLLLEHEEAAVGGDVVEDDVHDLLEDLLHRPHRDQGLRDLGQDLQDAVALLDLLDVRGLLDVGGRGGHGRRVVLQELGELADAADDRPCLFREGLGLVEDDLALDRLAEDELELAEQDLVAVLEGGLHHLHAVDLGAVLALEVGDADPVLVHEDAGVLAGDPEVLEDDLALGRAPDQHLTAREGVCLRGVSVLVEQAIHSCWRAHLARSIPYYSFSLQEFTRVLRVRSISSSTARAGRLALVEDRPHGPGDGHVDPGPARRARRRRASCARPRPADPGSRPASERPAPRAWPTRRLRERPPVQVRTRSPSPASPARVSARPP